MADGRLDETAYHEVLGRAGIVVSTADHEFQGLSVLEAVSAGALPLVPDALCYPEQFAPAYRYRPGDVAALVARLEDWLAGERPDIPDVSAWTGGGLATAWKGMLEDLTATSSRSPREVP